MSDEPIRQEEIRDHNALMEKIRILCDKLDELFLVYDQLQLAVPDHNADQDAHRDIRELIIAVDERESDHYTELSTTVSTNNTAVNTRIDNVTAVVTANNTALADKVSALETAADAILNSSVVYSNPLVSDVSSRTYLNASTGTVLLNSTAPYGYNMLLRVKSRDGVFTEGAYNNKYQVNYTEDATIAGAINRVDKTNTLIAENGDASFCNDVTVDGTLTATNIVGHVANADRAATADTATTANKATYLATNDTFNTSDTYLLKYTCGQFNGFVGSSNDVTVLSYPAGGTTVNNGIADIQNLRLLWAGNDAHWHDLFVSPKHRYIWHRCVISNTSKPWARIVEESSTEIWGINISGSAASATTATDATHAVSADTATTATNATNADRARLADDATHAVTADNAVNATNATYAATAGTATSAASATTAENATRATNDDQGNPIRSSYVTTTTAQTVAGDKTFTGIVTVKNDVVVSTQNPVITAKSSTLVAGTTPSTTITLGNKFFDKNSQVMSSVTYQVSDQGSSKLILACKRLDGNTVAGVSLGFNAADAAASTLNLNVDYVIPTKPKDSGGYGGVSLGKLTDTFTGVFTDGVTITEDDGIGTVKLLAREFTSNLVISAYTNVQGSSLYAVSFITSNVETSGSIVTANPTILINKGVGQIGTWQPLQYQSGAWRVGGNYIVSLYRRIL